MALTRPILLNVNAFDAANAQSFQFVVQGGDQVAANRLIVQRQDTQQVVYNQKIQSFKFQHDLQAGTLTNGVYYQATITTYNAAGDASNLSTPIQFYCYTTPSFAFNNLPANNLIDNDSFDFGVTYNQSEGELLNSYSFVLYDVQGVQLSTSGTQYVSAAATLPINIHYEFKGMADSTVYYIQAQGVTAGGTIIQTTRERIMVQYAQPATFSIVTLSNNCEGGYITIGSMFVSITGEVSPGSPKYVDDNTALDVRGDLDSVTFSGFTISGDFTASLWGRDFDINEGDIIWLRFVPRDETEQSLMDIQVGYRQDIDDANKVYADCCVTDFTRYHSLQYYIYSPSVAKPSSTDKMQFWLRRIGNLYTIELHNLGGGS